MRLSQAGSPDVKRWRKFGKTAAATFLVKPMWLSSPRFGASIPVGWRSKIIRLGWGWRPPCRRTCSDRLCRVRWSATVNSPLLPRFELAAIHYTPSPSIGNELFLDGVTKHFRLHRVEARERDNDGHFSEAPRQGQLFATIQSKTQRRADPRPRRPLPK